jgi:translation initiation factor 4E
MEVDKELDPEQYHPLEDTWTLWFQKQSENGTTSALSWLEGLKEVMSVGTVEEFWRMYNNIKTPNDMPAGTDYCLFKEGIEPKWEDPEHKVGGYFTVQLLGVEAEVFNKMWLHSLLACIGADFGHEEYETITGLYLSIRKKSAKISVWCRSPDQEQCDRVGERFQELLDELNPSGKVNFNFNPFPSVNAIAMDNKPYKGRGGKGGYNNRDNSNRDNRGDRDNRDNKREFNRDFQNRGKDTF